MLASLIAAFVSGETAWMLRRARRSAMLLGLALAAGLAGVAFLVGAGYIAAARRFGALEAAIGFGLGFIVLALLIVIVNAVASRSTRRDASSRRKSEVTAIATAAAVGMLPMLLKGRGSLGTLLAPALGLVAFMIWRENTRKGPDEPTD